MDVPKKLSEAIGHDLIEVFTREGGERCVWFLGKGRRDRSKEGGFSWLHYQYNIIPLAALLRDPLLDGDEANRVFNHNEDTYTEALDVFTVKYFYSDADTETATPFFEFREDIADGCYILRGPSEPKGDAHA